MNSIALSSKDVALIYYSIARLMCALYIFTPAPCAMILQDAFAHIMKVDPPVASNSLSISAGALARTSALRSLSTSMRQAPSTTITMLQQGSGVKSYEPPAVTEVHSTSNSGPREYLGLRYKSTQNLCWTK